MDEKRWSHFWKFENLQHHDKWWGSVIQLKAQVNGLKPNDEQIELRSNRKGHGGLLDSIVHLQKFMNVIWGFHFSPCFLLRVQCCVVSGAAPPSYTNTQNPDSVHWLSVLCSVCRQLSMWDRLYLAPGASYYFGKMGFNSRRSGELWPCQGSNPTEYSTHCCRNWVPLCQPLVFLQLHIYTLSRWNEIPVCNSHLMKTLNTSQCRIKHFTKVLKWVLHFTFSDPAYANTFLQNSLYDIVRKKWIPHFWNTSLGLSNNNTWLGLGKDSQIYS